MIYVYIGLAVVFLYYIYYNVSVNNNIKKYGEPEYFLKFILAPMKVTYPKYKKISENKGRIKYAFYDDLFELNLDFIYLPSKVQVSILMKSNFRNERRTATCLYDIDEIEKCCNKLIENIIL